jgi:SOS response regulatory protein OraA/RecX
LLGGGKLRERHDGNSGRRVAAALSELAQELKQQRFKSGETQEIAGKKTEEAAQTAAARAQGKIPRASVPSKSQTASQAL